MFRQLLLAVGAECSLWELLLAVGRSAIFVSFFWSRQLLLVSSASSGLVSLTASAFGLVEVGGMVPPPRRWCWTAIGAFPLPVCVNPSHFCVKAAQKSAAYSRKRV